MDLSESIDARARGVQKERKQVELLESLVRDGEIYVEMTEFDPRSEIPIFDAASSHSSKSRGHEANSHIRLKAVAAKYFLDQGDDVEYEKQTWFGIADVGTCCGSRYAECGTVRVGKFLESMGRESHLPLLGEQNPAYDTVEELIYIPYTENDDSPPFKIIRFVPEKCKNGY